jgi:hypothetical protein
MSELDPLAGRALSFLFTRCQARLDGDDLVVAVPSPQVSCRAASGAALEWQPPQPVNDPVQIACAGGPRQRADQSEYPVAQAYPSAVEFRFTGAVWYGRVPLRHAWALCVQGAVESLAGLPAEWASSDAILVETTFTAPERAPENAPGGRVAARVLQDGGGGPVNGPHLPWP